MEHPREYVTVQPRKLTIGLKAARTHQPHREIDRRTGLVGHTIACCGEREKPVGSIPLFVYIAGEDLQRIEARPMREHGLRQLCRDVRVIEPCTFTTVGLRHDPLGRFGGKFECTTGDTRVHGSGQY